MLASLLWAVGPVHFDEAKVPKQVHMWYDKPNGFFTTTDYFNTCAALRNSPCTRGAWLGRMLTRGARVAGRRLHALQNGREAPAGWAGGPCGC